MKLVLKSHWLICSVAAYFTVVLNLSLWRYVVLHTTPVAITDYIFLLTIPIFIFCCLVFLLSLVVLPYISKPVLIALLLMGSTANYAMYQLGIYIDSDMIRNILHTNHREASDLITVSGILWVMISGILPALILILTRIQYKSPVKELISRAMLIIFSILMVGTIAFMSYKEYASFGRNNRQVIRLINPTNFIYGIGRYYQKQQLVNREFATVDDQVTHKPFPDTHYTVFVLIVGETARSANFSLNGYQRLTNPEQIKHNVISFQNVSSCGTATAISVPCLFSHMSRQEFDADQAKYSENLLDLLQKTGYQVIWRENDDGCKGVCDRVKTDDMVKLNDPDYCDGSVCFDEVLLKGLKNYLEHIKQDTVIVLHTIGSHGPTYYKRYPESFKTFTPTCDTAEIQGCSQSDIINTYDNTILYTDYIIGQTIDLLKQYPNLESGLLYVSDHGESLGENNIYLHGLPYAIAPKEQTQVPMTLWLSDVMKKEDFLDESCLRNNALHQTYSHDYIFHSLLSLLEIESAAYDKKLDFFSNCRTEEISKINFVQ